MLKHDGKPGRKPLVYGKVRRPIPAYNPFEEDDTLMWRTQSVSSSSRKDESNLEQPQVRGQVVRSIEVNPIAKPSNVRQRTMSKHQPTLSDVTAQRGPGANSDCGNHQSTFDIPSSEEEDSTIPFQKSMQKRRRLTPVKISGSNVKVDQGRMSWSITKTDVNKNPPQLRARVPRRQSKMKTMPSPKAPQQLSPRPRTPSPAEDGNAASPSFCNTPKQTKLLTDLLVIAGPVDSPSKLPITSLSLTNAERSRPGLPTPRSKPLLHTKRDQGHILQSKKRLIDAMASPRKRLSVTGSSEASSEGSMLDAVSETSEVWSESQPAAAGNVEEANGISKAGDIIPNSTFTALSAVPKPRTTYSRERSHLADMLAEDALDLASQSASRENNLQASQSDSIFSSFDVVVSQEAAEEELEQEIGGIRSIHELRHAGSNARSRVDLESIFEDIEAKGSTARARRLRGLTQLAEKGDTPEIGRQILEQALDQRLSQCLFLGSDIVGETLLAMALCRLAMCVQLPITSLKGMLVARISSATTLLQEPRDFTKIVQDRKQNLSKATCRDITSLVEPFCSSLVWPSRRPRSISPQLVFTRFLDIILRQVRRLGDFDMVVPASIFDGIVRLLLQIEPDQLSDAQENGPALMMEFIVSVIESLTLSRNWSEDGCLEIAKQLSGLGPLLSRLTTPSLKSVNRTHHLILRLILNITNNDPDLCDAFTEPALLSAIFDIVRRDFIEKPTVTHAVSKETDLEGVILALGAMSNLAEHSDSFRRTMLDNLIEGTSMVEWIAYAFRNQAQQASEVRTLRLTQRRRTANIQLGVFCRTDNLSCSIWLLVGPTVQSLYR